MLTDSDVVRAIQAHAEQIPVPGYSGVELRVLAARKRRRANARRAALTITVGGVCALAFAVMPTPISRQSASRPAIRVPSSVGASVSAAVSPTAVTGWAPACAVPVAARMLGAAVSGNGVPAIALGGSSVVSASLVIRRPVSVDQLTLIVGRPGVTAELGPISDAPSGVELPPSVGDPKNRVAEQSISNPSADATVSVRVDDLEAGTYPVFAQIVYTGSATCGDDDMDSLGVMQTIGQLVVS